MKDKLFSLPMLAKAKYLLSFKWKKERKGKVKQKIDRKKIHTSIYERVNLTKYADLKE